MKIEISKRSQGTGEIKRNVMLVLNPAPDKARRMAALLLYAYLFLKRSSDLWPSPPAKANHLQGKHLAKHKKLSAPGYRPASAPRRGQTSPRRVSESRHT